MQIRTSKKPQPTKTMCLKPLTSLLIPKSRLTLTSHFSKTFQIPIYHGNVDFKILYGLFYSLTALNIHY